MSTKRQRKIKEQKELSSKAAWVAHFSALRLRRFKLKLEEFKIRLPRRYAPRNDAGVTPDLGLDFGYITITSCHDGLQSSGWHPRGKRNVLQVMSGRPPSPPTVSGDDVRKLDIDYI